MLVSAVAYKQRKEHTIPANAHPYLFVLALLVSIFYLLTLTVAALSVLFVTDPLGILQKSNIWLGPIQGLAASALGVFFAGDIEANSGAGSR